MHTVTHINAAAKQADPQHLVAGEGESQGQNVGQGPFWIHPLETCDCECPVLFSAATAKASGLGSWSVCLSRVRRAAYRNMWAVLPVCIHVHMCMEVRRHSLSQGTPGPSYGVANL